jgi:signal transduction histidine kinase
MNQKLHAFPALEVVQLSSTINKMVKERRSEDRRAIIDVALVPQLREANENLILATIGAQDAQAAAEAANQRQSEFLTMLAHELRNPLHPIIIANDLIEKIASSHPDLPTLHGIIQRQVAQLVRLVDDLLHASRVNAGKISIQTSCISLREIIERAVETSQPIIAARRQHLEFAFPAQGIFIDGDLIRLTQVFSNLLLNASKYTPEFGHLLIRVTPRQHEVEVAVIDDGAGVPLDIQPRIFELFVQGPCPQVPAQSGLGIGLSLVRTIVQLHRGTVSVSSAGSGTGSQFVVTLPRTAAPHLPG